MTEIKFYVIVSTYYTHPHTRDGSEEQSQRYTQEGDTEDTEENGRRRAEKWKKKGGNAN